MTWTTEPDSGGEMRWRSMERITSSVRDRNVAIEIRTENEVHAPDDLIPGSLLNQIPDTRTFHETSNPFCNRTRAFATVVSTNHIDERIEELRGIFDKVTFVEKAPRRFHPYGCAGYVIVSDDRINST